MGNINAHDPDYWNTSDDPGMRNTDWMSAIPDSTLISDMSIPGTHNTMAYATGKLLGAWVLCQSLTFGLQLAIGVRFFDIRCRHYYNGLPIHHDIVYLDTNFKQVLQTAASFLQSNPSEVLFVRVKEEYNPEQNTQPFWKTVSNAMDEFPNLFWMDTEISNIGQVRGKIVLLVNFQTDQVLGIPYGSLNIEDHYDLKKEAKKWNYVKGHLKASESGSSSTMFLTFNSFWSAKTPKEIARNMNPRLYTYVRSVGKARLGIIAMDYPGPDLVKSIIDTN